MFFAKCLHRRELQGPRDVRGVSAVCPWHKRCTAERPNRSLCQSPSWSKSLPYGPSALPVKTWARCSMEPVHSISHRSPRGAGEKDRCRDAFRVSGPCCMSRSRNRPSNRYLAHSKTTSPATGPIKRESSFQGLPALILHA